MKILLVNPPHPAIGSRIPREHLPPLGLLSIGGPLADAGHVVRLLDAEFGPMPVPRIVESAAAWDPDVVMIGHSGSSSGHPSAMAVARGIRRVLPGVWMVYGGVFPTYYGPEILEDEPSVDLVVRGEGEATAVGLVAALAAGQDLGTVAGVVYRAGTKPGVRREPGADVVGSPVANPAAPVIRDLDAWRVGWELIDPSRYTYYGGRRAVVAQFSRGCPHRCHYCGQHGFWRSWRHRDPVRFAAELARLHRERGVELVNLADENPTASRDAWRAFLEALIAENVPLVLIGTTRAGDIVRDADILHLYRRAGVARFLLGLESTDDATLRAIHKGSTQAIDREAIQLLRRHGILSMAAWVAGFARESDGDYWRTLRQLVAYDPDQIQALYATPHRWTRFAREAGRVRVLQTDLSRWDYKHQVLATEGVPPWRVLLWVKFIEAVCQLRPRSLRRLIAHPDPLARAGMRWYSGIGRRVWIHEIWQWLVQEHRVSDGPDVATFLAAPWRRSWPDRGLPVPEVAGPVDSRPVQLAGSRQERTVSASVRSS